MVSGYLEGGEAAIWAIAGRVRAVTRCDAMQSTETARLAPELQVGRHGTFLLSSAALLQGEVNQ